MQVVWTTTCWAILCSFLFLTGGSTAFSTTPVSLQEDGSLVVFDTKGLVADLVRQGTPRQSVQIGGQTCNVNYGFNSAGKKTLLISVPATSTEAVVFDLNEKRITIPPKSALRLVLTQENKIEKMDGNPAGTVVFAPADSSAQISKTSPPPPPAPVPAATPPPSQTSPVPSPAPMESLPAEEPPVSRSSNSPAPGAGAASPAPAEMPGTDQGTMEAEWPGKLLQPPLTPNQVEEEKFYARTEFGPRFVSSLNLVSVSGPNSAVAAYNQKEIAFSTGYRQDLDVGVWLTEWFGLAVETGFALNAVRGNTQGMSVSSSTFWTVPLLAQLCFQYPNESGWIPYLNFGFGGGLTVLKVGAINYLTGVPQLSGTGSSVNNAYQIAAGVRYRLYEDLSLTLAYKFYGNSQATINLDNGVQATLGSPVTNSAEVGVNFSF